MPRETKDAPLSWRLIGFEDAHIEMSSDEYYEYLVVSGLVPYANMKIEVTPLVYADTPDYWSFEVVGKIEKYAIPAITPFEIIVVLDHPYGNKGIEVTGANGAAKQLDYKYSKKQNPDGGTKIIRLGERKE